MFTSRKNDYTSCSTTIVSSLNFPAAYSILYSILYPLNYTTMIKCCVETVCIFKLAVRDRKCFKHEISYVIFKNKNFKF